MPLDAEPLFAALFARLQTLSASFRTISRVHPRDLPSPQIQPAIYLEGRSRRPKQEIGRKAVWTVGALATIYCRNDSNPGTAPMTQINALIKLVDAALERQGGEQSPMGSPHNQTTLGGLCQVCWISESDPHGVQIFEGIQDNQAMVLIPIDMIGVA